MAVLALSTACSDDSGNDVVSSEDAGGGGSDRDGGTQNDAGQVRTDGQIASIVSTANTGEVAQAQVALSKAEDAQVRDYAQHMITEHTAAEQRLTQLLTAAGITPQPSQVSTSLKADSDRVVQQLTATAAGPNFDSVYIQSQIAVHQKVLDLVDDELIPSAQNSTLQDELQATSDAVSKHLEDAEDIADTLDENAGGDAGAADGGEDGDGGGDGHGGDSGDAGTGTGTGGRGSSTGL